MPHWPDSLLPPKQNLTPATASLALCPLPDVGFLTISGEQRRTLLQGQATCDVNAINTEHSSLGALCNPKGRMLAWFRCAEQDDRLLLRMPHDVAVATHAHLAKYAVFFKTQLTVAEDKLALGLCGEGAADWLKQQGQHPPESIGGCTQTDDALVIKVGENRFEAWLPTKLAEPWLKNETLTHGGYWHAQAIAEGEGEIYLSTQNQFIPQELNLQALGGISFNKGCYTGQEIVARVKYLGKLKKHAVPATTTDTTPLEPGTPLQDDTGKAIGHVVRNATLTDTQHLLLVARLDTIEKAQPLYAEQSTTPIQLTPLPYSLDD